MRDRKRETDREREKEGENEREDKQREFGQLYVLGNSLSNSILGAITHAL